MTKYKNQRSTTGGNVPSSMSGGELAVNLVDKRLFTANTTAIFDAFQNTISSIAITNSSGAALNVGNSTVNSSINSLSLSLSNSTVTFSLTKPTAAQVTDGAYFPGSNGTWQKPAGGGGSPGGSNTYIQFNDSSSFGGDANLTFDKATETFATVNEVLSGNLTANSDYVSIGNSTINTVINSVSFVTGNSTVTATVNSTALMFGASSIGSTSSSNGYSVMPNGLIFQWGYVSTVNTTAGDATFTLPFTTACFSVVVTSNNSSVNVYANGVNTTVAQLRSTTSRGCWYMAIGK